MIKSLLDKVFALLAHIRGSRSNLPAGFYLVLFWVMCAAVVVWYFVRRYTL